MTKISEWIGLIGGTAGIASFVWTWILSSQQCKINEHILREKDEAVDRSKQALIRAEGYKHSGATWRIKLRNDGDSPARNIRIDFCDLDSAQIARMFADDGILPLSLLNKGDSVEMRVIPSGRLKRPIEIVLTWDDESKEGRARSQILSF